jgi:hypothetical protein
MPIIRPLLTVLIIVAIDTDIGRSSEHDEIIAMVISSIEENNRCLGNVKVDVEKRLVSMGKISQPTETDVKKKTGTLQIHVDLKPDGTPAPEVRRWTALVGGNDHRYEILGAHGKEVYSLDSNGITMYSANAKEAMIMNWDPEQTMSSHQQLDPREIGFLSMKERFIDILKAAGAESATVDTTSNGTVATIRVESPVFQRPVVVECSSAVNFLPTRVVYWLKEGYIDAITDITYQSVVTSCGPRWFVKSAVRRQAFPHLITSVDAKNWGKVITTTVSNLKVNTTAPPPRDTAASFPPGTRIRDMTAQPLSTNESGLRGGRLWLVVITVLGVSVFLGILLWRQFRARSS